MAGSRKDSNGRLLPQNVTQRKDGTYMWKKTEDGKSYYLYAKTLGEMKQKIIDTQKAIKDGTYKGKHKKMQEERELAKQDITLNEWFPKWEKLYREGKVRTSTLNLNHSHYMLYFSDNIGRMKLKQIKQMDILKVYNELKSNGMKRTSLERYHTVLMLLFKAAMENGMIEKNPAIGALQIPKEKAVEKRILTEEEEKRFFDYISHNGYHKKMVPLFTVGFGTGMRIGEIVALTWNDIDFDNNIIHVTKTLSYIHIDKKMSFKMNPPKTESSIRDVPMLPRVREALLLQKQIQTKSTVTIDGYKDFVFTTKSGNTYTASNIWYSLCAIADGMNKRENENAQLEGREPIYFERFSAHSMRHTFATRCYEKGVKEKVIQKILGHSTLDITLNIYTHVTDSMIADDIKKLVD